MPKSPNEAIRVATYEELLRYVNAFKSGHLSLLIVIGLRGLQKSRIIREAVGGHALWLEGNATAFGMYRELYRHRDEPVVIDDVDGLYRDPAAVRLLKSVCQTEPTKTVAWQSDAKALTREDIPRQFRTRSRVCMIANEWKTLNANVAAVEDRGHVVVFQPTPLEVHLRTAQWFCDQEIYDFIGYNLHLVAAPTMRNYSLAWEQKKAGLEWKVFLLNRWLSGTALVVATLVFNPAFRSEEDRVREFERITGHSRSTYFYNKRKLQPAVLPPDIKLNNDCPPPAEREEMDLLALLKSRRYRLGNG